MEEIAIYARVQAIPDVADRAEYISSHKRQERLLAVYGQTDMTFWKELAEDAQQAWRESGGERKKTVERWNREGTEKTSVEVEKKASEAREIQLPLPRVVLEMSSEAREKMLKSLYTFFETKYGATCLLGLHLSENDLNIHVHILIADRQRLPEPVIRIADRNAFLDERGVRKRTKKEILDEQGNIRKGCRIVPKGDVLSVRRFGDKDPLFADHNWCYVCKEDLADWINDYLKPDKRRTVFDPQGPYLAQEHIGKGLPPGKRKKLEAYNRDVQCYDRLVEVGYLSLEEAYRAKSYVQLSPDRQSALSSVLAMLLMEKPESRRCFAGNELSRATERKLLEIYGYETGGKRTYYATEEEKKNRLRKLYREAAQHRLAAKNASSGLDRSVSLAQARKCSAEIDRLRHELGLYSEDDYQRKLRLIEEELRRRMRWLSSCRAKAVAAHRRVERIKHDIESMQKELEELPVIFRTKSVRSQEQSLKQRIQNAKEELELYKEEEKELWEAYALERRKAEDERKRLRQERKELRKEYRKKRKEKGKEKDITR